MDLIGAEELQVAYDATLGMFETEGNINLHDAAVAAGVNDSQLGEWAAANAISDDAFNEIEKTLALVVQAGTPAQVAVRTLLVATFQGGVIVGARAARSQSS